MVPVDHLRSPGGNVPQRPFEMDRLEPELRKWISFAGHFAFAFQPSLSQLAGARKMLRARRSADCASHQSQ
jgi:hypothetical protein